MNLDIFKKFLSTNKQDSVQVVGKWKRTITRADGTVEELFLKNIVTSAGLDALASRAVLDTTSAFNHLAVGTQTAAASLGSVQGGFGEVDRKVPTTKTSSNEVAYMVNTWGGSADSVTSLVLESAAIFNHVNSGSGIMLNQVSGVSATLADSDFLKLEVQVQIGSHNL